MSPHLIPHYRPTMELAVDAMISEGGALRQPSMRDTKEVFARLGRPCRSFSASLHEWMHNPTAMFWTGFATGFAISLLDKAAHAEPHA
jgi:hypothetical protein